MTKKDFQTVANAIANSPTNESALAVMLADTFQAAYPRFDRMRFLKACGVWGKAAEQL